MTAGVEVPAHRCRAVARALRDAVDRLEATDRLPPAGWVIDLLGELDAAAEHAGADPVPTVDRDPPPPHHWVGTAEAAATLGISERAIRKRIERGDLAAVMWRGAWRIDLGEDSCTTRHRTSSTATA